MQNKEEERQIREDKEGKEATNGIEKVTGDDKEGMVLCFGKNTYKDDDGEIFRKFRRNIIEGKIQKGKD